MSHKQFWVPLGQDSPIQRTQVDSAGLATMIQPVHRVIFLGCHLARETIRPHPYTASDRSIPGAMMATALRLTILGAVLAVEVVGTPRLGRAAGLEDQARCRKLASGPETGKGAWHSHSFALLFASVYCNARVSMDVENFLFN